MELLIVHRKELSDTEWEIDAMVYPGKRFKIGAQLDLSLSQSVAPSLPGLPRHSSRPWKSEDPNIGAAPPALMAEVLSVSDIGRRIRLRSIRGPVRDILQTSGHVPFPPYITNPHIHPDRYQTCFARPAGRSEGSVAAPTAGLHFTPELLRQLETADIRTVFLTLQVGPGTFRPVTSREMETGRLHPEPYRLDEATARMIEETRAAGRRVIGVGTTVCRTLEWIAAKYGHIRADEGETDLFIRENFSFRAVDALLTNFHLPRTSLLMLVSAFAGREFTLDAYRHAVQSRYRFYSFGDAMLIL